MTHGLSSRGRQAPFNSVSGVYGSVRPDGQPHPPAGWLRMTSDHSPAAIHSCRALCPWAAPLVLPG